MMILGTFTSEMTKNVDRGGIPDDRPHLFSEVDSADESIPGRTLRLSLKLVEEQARSEIEE